MKKLSIVCFFVAFTFVDSDIETYIGGGEFAKRGQYPHSVFLIISCKYTVLCGGSILNQFIVLTAAHCMERCIKVRTKVAEIRYGHEDIEKMKITSLHKYVQHEHYDEIRVANDISMMSTTDEMLLNNYVKRVIIMKNPPVVDYAYVAGWGIDENGDKVHSLKHTDARIQPEKVCAKLGNLPLGTFCAGPITGLGTVKVGDSGAAIVVSGYIQIGLVSFSVQKYSFGAYTNVTYHLNWIKKNSKRLYCAGKKE